MGGLLAADAAIDSFNRTTRRIIGVLAFDTPYLGMHPHVVISGITSLFPKDDNGMGKGMTAREDETERDLNDESQVNVVDEGVTDDWDAFKKRLDGNDFSLDTLYGIHFKTHSITL